MGNVVKYSFRHEALGYDANNGERPSHLFYFQWGFDDDGVPQLYRIGQFTGHISEMPIPAWVTFL